MKKLASTLTCILTTALAMAQIPDRVPIDSVLKVTIYTANKQKVLNYSSKQFDALFFEFFTKKADPAILLTKEEFYGYTIQIAIYSDRLVVLYPDEKVAASANKLRWFAESYEKYAEKKPIRK